MMEYQNVQKLLAVCLGNICRSPIAHGLLQEKLSKISSDYIVDSAGTNGLHNDEKPDRRSIKKMKEYGIDISKQRSRQIIPQDIVDFDLILVMDASNYQNVINLCQNKTQKDKVKMIMNYVSPGLNESVPDPYYGGDDGFESVYQMLDQASNALIEKITQ